VPAASRFDPGGTGFVAVAWVLFWVLMVAVALQDYAQDGGTDYWEPLLWEGSSALVATALVLLHVRLQRGSDALLATPARWFARMFAPLPLFFVTFIVVTYALRHAVYAALGREYDHAPWPETFLYESVKLALFFGIWSVVLFGLRSYRMLADERVEAERVRASLREEQVRRLTAQIQPHFLFNSLNLVSSVMHEDVARADALLTRLGDLLRGSLAMGDAPSVAVGEELRLLRAYGEIMGERFVGRVTIEYDLDPRAEACRLPPFTLQTLLENVFKHTVERQREPTRIRVSVRRDGARVIAAVEDDRGRLAPGAGGIGLSNVRTRLAAVHGAAATLDVVPLEPAGVRSTVVVPCEC
jgi:hypothetical protein